jgi:hypothetical protein
MTGKLRRDLNVAADAEVKYRLWKKRRNRFGDLWADVRISYERNVSNTLFEDFFQTNYQDLTLTGGLLLELK